MSICKNIECKNKTNEKRIYCSLTCRSYYVNIYLRDYSKNKKGYIKRIIKFKEKYESLNKICLCCDTKISFEKRNNIFCNNHCSVTYNNKKRIIINRKPFSKEAIKNIKIANRKRVGATLGKYENNPNKCINCDTNLKYKFRKRKFCNRKCKNEYYRKQMSEYTKYKYDSRFKFSLNEFSDEFEFGLIKKYGWYSPSNSKIPNLGGISRDHKISVRYGFESGINSNIISHPANCELMIHNENIGKNKNSSISKKKLIELIDKWNKKYKRVL